MSNDRFTGTRPVDEFERVKAIVTSYRLVDTPAIIAAREYGYDIGLLKSRVAYALSYQAPPTAEGRVPGAAHVRESRSVVFQDRRISKSAIVILRQLMANRIRFLVLGGVAAQLHGSSRVTHDLDILYDRSPDNVERLAALLMQWGPTCTAQAMVCRLLLTLTPSRTPRYLRSRPSMESSMCFSGFWVWGITKTP